MIGNLMIYTLLAAGVFIFSFCVLIIFIHVASFFMEKIIARVSSIKVSTVNINHKDSMSYLYRLDVEYEYQIDDFKFTSNCTFPLIGVFSLKKQKIDRIINQRVFDEKIEIRVFRLIPRFSIAFPNGYNKAFVGYLLFFSLLLTWIAI